MRRTGRILLAGLLLAVTAAAAETSGVPLSTLVFEAVDTGPADADAALAALVRHPEANWRSVAEVLAAGRTHDPDFRPAPPVTDAEAFRTYFAKFPWEPGRVRAYPIGDDYPYFYSIRLPAGYDGKQPLPVLLNLGLGRFEGPPPAGLLAVELNPLIPSSLSLGEAPLSMTAGTAGQSVILSVIADLERHVNVDRDRVFLGGYSRFGNATWYLGLHRPDLFAGIVPASGYYAVEDALLENLLPVPVLALAGDDRFHRAANEYTVKTAKKLERKGHSDVTLVESEGKAVAQEVVPRICEWIGERRRDPRPAEVSFTLFDPRDAGAFWVRIDEVEKTGGTRTVVIQGGDERFEVHRRPASVTATNLGENRVRLRVRNVAALRLLLSPETFDLTAPVTVEIGGRTRKLDPEPSIETLVRNFRRDRDRRRLYPAVLSVRP